jgi:hypothetical protein
LCGKELAKLLEELRRERLVVRDDQRRHLEPRDHVRHRERLARAGHAEQRLGLPLRNAATSLSIACG